MIKMNNVNMSKRSEMRETTRSCIATKYGGCIWQESRILARAMQKELPFVIHQKNRDELKRQENKKCFGGNNQFLFIS
jgi:hypothetical protein